MISVEIEIDGTKVLFKHPDSFNELLREQFEKAVELFVLNKNSLEERVDDKLILMESFLRRTEKKSEKKKVFKVIESIVEDGVLDELLKLQGFLYEDQDFNNWIINLVSIDKEFYYGPKNQFSYMLFGEFIVADMLFMNYFESENEDVLNKFIAVLYRNSVKNYNPKSNKDIRIQFDGEFLDHRSLVIAKLSSITKQAILFNYAGVRYWLTKKYPFVFGSGKKENKQNIEFGNNRAGWMNIRRNLAGNVFNLEKVDSLLLSDVLSELNEKMSKS